MEVVTMQLVLELPPLVLAKRLVTYAWATTPPA